jgi:cation diffusion facilitator family transporter
MDAFRQDRTYLGADHRRNERRTWIVTAICGATLLAQVGGGIAFKSMALTAAGLHMAAHVAALLTASLSYALARRFAKDARFSFGAGKLGYLAGFANAVLLAGTALLIGVESLERLLAPEAVEYDAALTLAAVGLAINAVCVILLRPPRRAAGDGDLNLMAAHLHLSADLLAGVLAMAGLAAGRELGWAWSDPAAGLASAALVAHFSWGLIRRAGAALLDMNPSAALTQEIRERLSAGGERVLDLHLWRLGPGHHAAIAVISAPQPEEPEIYRKRLRDVPGLSHVTVEVRAQAR